MNDTGSTATAPAVGFVGPAPADPGRFALVAPDGTRWTARELLADANRRCTGGARPGWSGATPSPPSCPTARNWSPPSSPPPRPALPGPGQPPPGRPGDRRHVADSGAKVLIADAVMRRAAIVAADEAGRPRSTATPSASCPVSGRAGCCWSARPGPRTTGPPVARRTTPPAPPAGRADPPPAARDGAEHPGLGGFLGISGPPGRGRRPPGLLAALPHRRAPVAGASLHLGHPVVLMDRWTPEEMLRLTDRHRVTDTHMVPTQFHRLLALPAEVHARYDVSAMRGTPSTAPHPARTM